MYNTYTRTHNQGYGRVQRGIKGAFAQGKSFERVVNFLKTKLPWEEGKKCISTI